MKIRLAILEKDVNYLNRITSVFSSKYADKLEVYSFTGLPPMMEALDSSKIDVLIAGDNFDVDVSSLPKRCGFAYFVDSSDVRTVKNQHAIGKFQKAELIYKQILSLYSEKADSVLGRSIGDSIAKVIFFTSVSGGAGASSLAAAFAMRIARYNKKALYLNLEKFGSADVFFEAGGNFDMSDIIFALKSRKANLSLKLESCVKMDTRGVFFYSAPKMALDMMELTEDDIAELLDVLRNTGGYDYIIVDTEFSMTSQWLSIYNSAYEVVWVGEGNRISNGKISSAYYSVSVREQASDSPITDRIFLICNKFRDKTDVVPESEVLRCIGCAPRYEYAKTEKITEELSRLDFLDKIM